MEYMELIKIVVMLCQIPAASINLESGAELKANLKIIEARQLTCTMDYLLCLEPGNSLDACIEQRQTHLWVE